MSHLPNVYAIIAIDAAAAVDYSQIGETSIDTIRMNLALTEFVIKWFDEHEPTFIADGTIVPLQTLTHQEALTLMATPEWSEPIPE
jgi:uncharacterized membrane protein